MGGKADVPAAPDYSAIAAASQEAAELQYATAQDQLAWAREQYASDYQLTEQIVGQALDINRENAAAARADRQRYQSVFQPLEDELVADARSYNSAERRALEAGRAVADVSQQFDKARMAAAERLEGYGIDPSQTRAGALDTSMRMTQAAAQAGAANQSRVNTENIGRALRGEAINIGRGYPGQVAQAYGTALQAGTQAASTRLATTASGAQTMGTAPQYYGLANNSLNTWSNALTSGYNAQLAQYDREARQDQGAGSLFGMVAGAGLRLLPFFSEGGQVPQGGFPDAPGNAPQGVPTPQSQMPQGAPPAQGAIPAQPHDPQGRADDVPIAVSGGEYVIPKSVVMVKGTEFFDRLVQKYGDQRDAQAAQQRQQTGQPGGKPATAIPMG